MSVRFFASAVAVVGLSLAIPADARAQWDAPSFLPPRPGSDIGIYLSDQADFGVHAIWRQETAGGFNLGVRLGFVDTPGDGIILVGMETWGPVMSAGANFPVDVTWSLGGGASFNGSTVVEVPFGVSIGRLFVLTPLTFQVYGHPRLGIFIQSVADEVDLDLDGLFDLGADFHIGRSTKLRLGATLGESDALGVGLAFALGRTVAVR